MTAFGSVSTAVEAMKAGAFDYVQKPFEIEEMELQMTRLGCGACSPIDYRGTRRETLRLRSHHRSSGALEK